VQGYNAKNGRQFHSVYYYRPTISSGIYGQEKTESLLKEVIKKSIEPSEEEIKANPRARSARLRIAEKI